jgi:proliferating cell nuclear antigen
MQLVTIEDKLKATFELLKDMFVNLTIVFNSESVTIKAGKNGTSHVGVTLKAESFESYYCSGVHNVTVAMKDCYNSMYSVKTNDVIVWRLFNETCKQKITLMVDSSITGRRTKSDASMQDINEMIVKIPDYNMYNAGVVTMSTTEFHNDFKMLNRYEDSNVTICVNKGDIQFYVRGTTADFEITEKGEFRGSEKDGNLLKAKETFSLKSLSVMAKAHQVSETMEIFIKEDYPIVIKFPIGNLGTMLFILGQIEAETVYDESKVDEDISNSLKSGDNLDDNILLNNEDLINEDNNNYMDDFE